MTDTLTFRYTVVEGDETDTFDILDTRTAKRQLFSTALVRPAAAEVRVNKTKKKAAPYPFLAAEYCTTACVFQIHNFE